MQLSYCLSEACGFLSRISLISLLSASSKRYNRCWLFMARWVAYIPLSAGGLKERVAKFSFNRDFL